MLIDLSSGAGPANLEVDVCIIGGGPAGILVAGEFLNTNHTVALLEAGSLEPDTETQFLNLGRASGPLARKDPFYLSTSRLRIFGGSQLAWGGWSTPLLNLDLEAREWVPESGWPLSMSQIVPYYQRAACIFGLHESTATPAPERPVLDGELTERVFYFAPGRRTARDIFQQRLADADNMSVCLGVTAVGARCEAGNLQEIRTRSLGGAELSVKARQFLLAAGGIENARFLLANEIGSARDLAGRFFMEHPHVVLGSVYLPDRARWVGYLETMDPELKHGVMLALGLPAEVQRRNGLLNGAVQLWPEPGSETDGDGLRARLLLRAEQLPNRESRVTLDTDTDPFGVPAARLRWELTPQDWASACCTARMIAAALRRHADAEVELTVSDDSPWPDFPVNQDRYKPWGCHHMGTTRMSDDSRRGVVDPDARVYGTDNLFVAGSSIFATGGFANPTFTLMALALRTADHLKTLM